jgi:3-hydroxyacyl-[acyl-carrier-protein] dehydratase
MDKLNTTQILKLIPHKAPFRFIDGLTEVNEKLAEGFYRFREDESFYKGHFDFKPVTPGVILTETMAQIGLLPMGIYILHEAGYHAIMPLIIKTEIYFEKIVLPGEKVTVKGNRKFYKMGILGADVTMYNEPGELIAYGEIRGKINMQL